MPPQHVTTCWVVTDGKAGMESQCLGLAEALGITPQIKRLQPRFPWSHLPPQLWALPLCGLSPSGDRRAPPWPDLLIATGRATVAPALAIKRQSPSTVVVQIQNPRAGAARFDLIIAPAHDRMTGPNILETTGALHRVTAKRLAEAAEAFRGRFGGGLAITPSRRTGAENLKRITAPLAGSATDIWDGTGENPYFGILALADALIVTSDSVNMVTEACATGKPVHVFDLEGGSAKFSRFHEALRRKGMTRPFTGDLGDPGDRTHTPPDDMARAAAAVRALLTR